MATGPTTAVMYINMEEQADGHLLMLSPFTENDPQWDANHMYLGHNENTNDAALEKITAMFKLAGITLKQE